MGQCRTLDADVSIGCYYGDYSSCDNTIPTSLFIRNNFFPLTLVSYLSHLFKLLLLVKIPKTTSKGPESFTESSPT